MLFWEDAKDGHGWKWVPAVEVPTAARALEALCLPQFGLLDMEVADLTHGLPRVRLLKRSYMQWLDSKICNGARRYLVSVVPPALIEPAPTPARRTPARSRPHEEGPPPEVAAGGAPPPPRHPPPASGAGPSPGARGGDERLTMRAAGMWGERFPGAKIDWR